MTNTAKYIFRRIMKTSKYYVLYIIELRKIKKMYTSQDYDDGKIYRSQILEYTVGHNKRVFLSCYVKS